MRHIELVLFDLDDTLHDDTYAYRSAAEEVAREVAAERGMDALALKAAYVAEAEGFWHRLSAADLQTKLSSVRASMWGNALESVGVRDPDLARRSAERYNAYRVKYYTVFPGAVELLRALRERGMRLGIVTNGLSETHREKIALLQLGEYFDAIFLSDEVGMVKPDPLLFAHACRVLGGAPAAAAWLAIATIETSAAPPKPGSSRSGSTCVPRSCRPALRHPTQPAPRSPRSGAYFYPRSVYRKVACP